MTPDIILDPELPQASRPPLPGRALALREASNTALLPPRGRAFLQKKLLDPREGVRAAALHSTEVYIGVGGGGGRHALGDRSQRARKQRAQRLDHERALDFGFGSVGSGPRPGSRGAACLHGGVRDRGLEPPGREEGNDGELPNWGNGIDGQMGSVR
jgi:hypothetical protein